MDDRKVFDKNLSCLRKRYPHLFALSSTVRPLDRAELHPPADDDKTRIDAAVQTGIDFLFLIGMGDGSTFIRYANRMLCDNKGVLVIEPQVERFAAVLRKYDFRKWFSSGKVFWVIGSQTKKEVDAIFTRSLCFAAEKPFFALNANRESNERHEELNVLLLWVRNELARRKKALIDDLKSLPSTLCVEKGRPLRIWSFDDFRGKARYSTVQSILMRNLMHGLRERGYETQYEVMNDGRYYPPYYRIFKMALFRPDVVFLCNLGPAYEMALGAEMSRSLKIPKVVWFADDPIYGEHLLRRHKTSPDETYLVADYEWADPLVENGASPPVFMPGAATRIRRGKKRSKHACEIVFVGQIRDRRAFLSSLSPEWCGYCEKVVREKLRYPRKKVREVMAQFPMPGQLNADRMDELRQQVLWEANTRFRLTVVAALAKYDLRIYGNDAWKSLLPPKIVERSFRGVLPFKRLFDVYRNAKITLNIHSLQSYTCLNVRDFDVPAAGGFLISDWLPRAEEIFKPGFANDLPLKDDAQNEIFFYRTAPELKQLVDYFIVNEDRRGECIERARKRIVAAHTYAHRAEFLDGVIQKIVKPFTNESDSSVNG